MSIPGRDAYSRWVCASYIYRYNKICAYLTEQGYNDTYCKLNISEFYKTLEAYYPELVKYYYLGVEATRARSSLEYKYIADVLPSEYEELRELTRLVGDAIFAESVIRYALTYSVRRGHTSPFRVVLSEEEFVLTSYKVAAGKSSSSFTDIMLAYLKGKIGASYTNNKSLFLPDKDARLDKVYLPLILSGRILPLTKSCVDWVKLYDKHEKQIDNEINTLIRKFTKSDYDVRVGFINYKADRYICPPSYDYVFDKYAKAIDYFSGEIIPDIHISGEFVSEFDVQKYKLKIIGGGITVNRITYYPLVSLDGVDPMETVYSR